jgi:hypothetical protein
MVEDTYVQLKLRVRASLRTALQEAADNSGSPPNSLNQECVERLERTLAEDQTLAEARRENYELRETMRRLVDAFDKALDTIRPDPLLEYRREAGQARQGRSEP